MALIMLRPKVKCPLSKPALKRLRLLLLSEFLEPPTLGNTPLPTALSTAISLTSQEVIHRHRAIILSTLRRHTSSPTCKYPT